MKIPFLKALIPKSDPSDNRSYFEVWGEALDQVQFLKKLSLGMVLANLLGLVLLKRSLQKPPLVIRVNEVGQAEPVKNVNVESRLTKPEVLNFVRLFMKYYLERNTYTWKDNLQDAGLLMTPVFREKAEKLLSRDPDMALVQTNKWTTKLQFSSIEISRETSDNVLVSLKGWRQITSFEDAKFLKETIFQGELVLKKVPRTMETPYGLLVDAYTQTDFKSE